MFGLVFGWQGKVYKLRKNYDKIREKADKQSDSQKRLYILRILDQAEPTLIMLEEQRISRFDRGRLHASVESVIEQAKFVLEEKFIPQTQQSQQQSQYPNVPAPQQFRR